MISFSIIIPVHNGGSYLKICIESILKQEYINFNIIVLENASTDGTNEWLETLKDSRIKVFPSSSFLSIEENWKRVIELQTNEFITLLGHDDELLPGYLTEMNSLIQMNFAASLFQTRFNYINKSGKFIRSSRKLVAKLSVSDFLDLQFANNLDSTGTGYVFKMSDYKSVKGMHTEYPKLIFADFQLWVQLIQKSYLAYSEKICFNYRIHESVSKLANGETYVKAFLKYLLFLNSHKNHTGIQKALDNYGPQFLQFYARSLSHRIIKSDENYRETSVSTFLKSCKSISQKLFTYKRFNPNLQLQVIAALIIDSNKITRKYFRNLRK